MLALIAIANVALIIGSVAWTVVATGWIVQQTIGVPARVGKALNRIFK